MARPKTVARNIYFFRAFAGYTPEKNRVPVNVATTMAQLNSLPFAKGSQRYLDYDGSDVMCGWVDQAVHPCRMRLAHIRRYALPLVEQWGKLSSVSLPADGGVCEPIHAVFFADNIVGVEYNFFGPRPSWIPTYLQSFANSACPPFALHPLLKGNTADQLEKLSEIRILELAVRASYVATVRQASQDLANTFQAATTASDARIIGISLRPEPWQDQRLSASLLEGLKRLARRDDLRDNVRTFRVSGRKGDDHSTVAFDVLKDHFVANEQIVKLSERSRAVKDSAAYEAIEKAYQDMRSELEGAADVDAT